MEFDVNAMIVKAMPVLKTGMWVILATGVTIALGYYLFVVMRRKRWFINIWELKSNGKIYLVSKDILIARKFNNGKQVCYLMKRNKVETIPPPDECVDRLGNKEVANYLRVLDDYIPLKREVTFPEEKLSFIKKVKEAVLSIKTMGINQVRSEFVYIPLDRSLTGKLSFVPIDYDVNMMRINALDNKEKIYADSKNFLEKYGAFIAIGAIIVLIIVVLYFSYDYSTNVIQMAMGAADKVSTPLQQLVEKLNGNIPQ